MFHEVRVPSVVSNKCYRFIYKPKITPKFAPRNPEPPAIFKNIMPLVFSSFRKAGILYYYYLEILQLSPSGCIQSSILICAMDGILKTMRKKKRSGRYCLQLSVNAPSLRRT
jgi:hypothetical protein